MSAAQDACPLAAIHRRLDDAHHYWHDADAGYFEPDQFRRAAQTCIQRLREVSFILQSEKSAIPDFDAWYGRWQERMRADPLMRWSISARNKIEKQGDLATNSVVHAQVIASYLDLFPVVEVKAELFEPLTAALGRVPRDALKKQVLEHGMMRVDRRWVDDQLPDRELLDALSHVYGQLCLLLDDAHKQCGIPVHDPVVVQHGHKMDNYPAGRDHLCGRLPCMFATDEKRALFVSLKTGEISRVAPITLNVDPAGPELAAERYGLKKVIGGSKKPSSLRELCVRLFQVGRAMFLKDGRHIPIAILLRDNTPLGQLILPADTRAEKYLLMRQLAKAVERTGADAVVKIGEAWLGEPKDDPFAYPADDPHRKECLWLAACSKTDEAFSFTAEISRDGDRVTLGETNELDVDAADMFEPVREVWRRRQ